MKKLFLANLIFESKLLNNNEKIKYLKFLNEYRRTPVSGPKTVDNYFKDCMKNEKKKSKEYCANKNKDYPGCTKYGKTWGKPYSGPIKKKK